MFGEPIAAPHHDDRVLPFEVPPLDVRGRVVELGPAIDAILDRHDYPAPVARLLAQLLTIAALLGSSLKFEGKFIVQAQTEGPVSLLIADYRPGGALRGYARFDADAIDLDAPSAGDFALLGKGVLAFTVDQGEFMQRYQGLVALDGSSLEEAAKAYFRQSEQLPTEVRLAVAKDIRSDGAGGLKERWRAGGLIVQFLPEAPDRIVRQDLPGGDGAEDLDDEPEVDDAWNEARILARSAEDLELTDPEVGAERLVYRLFHEHQPRAFSSIALKDQCSCSREKVGAMLRGFSDEDRAESTVDGKISVDCEFCSTHYEFVTEDL